MGVWNMFTIAWWCRFFETRTAKKSMKRPLETTGERCGEHT
jgi:hypothetical protein